MKTAAATASVWLLERQGRRRQTLAFQEPDDGVVVHTRAGGAFEAGGLYVLPFVKGIEAGP
ncbi:hypothetical protein ABTZ59_22985 [Streptomyces sp. NPDC094034]|uniref:hypothetical protein n=1 Tax=Streptomyces sp. NPDC094034 TaxID=3155309 RepID=UPI00331EE366